MTKDEVERTLQLCKIINVKESELLAKKGASADRFFILLNGVLAIETDGCELASIEAISIVGETGFFLGLERSVDIRAAADCVLLVLDNDTLSLEVEDSLFLRNRILDNLNHSLVCKLRASNLAIEIPRQRPYFP